jgi:hypothetical protein
MENSTPVSTRALLLVLEKIKSNVMLDDKPPSKDKAKGADSKRKIDFIDARIPKKAKKGWTEKHCSIWGYTHQAQHQGVQVLQQGWKSQEGRGDA